MTHQIRSIDYQHRNLQVVETCDILTWTDVLKLHLTKNRLKIFQAVRYIIYLLLRQFQQ